MKKKKPFPPSLVKKTKSLTDPADYDAINEQADIAVDIFEIANLSVEELRNQLGGVPAQMAYWGRQKAILQRKLKSMKIQYEMWYSRQHLLAEKAFPKKQSAGYYKSYIWAKNKNMVLSYHVKLDKEKDIAHSEESLSEPGQSKNLKIPDGKTPVYILSPDYADGYVHWLSLPDGSALRVLSGGGLEGKGFAPPECALCKKTVATSTAAAHPSDKKT